MWPHFYKPIQARRRLGKILSNIIKEREEGRSEKKGLLGCLLNFRAENGQILADDQIADNIIGVLFAAQDTTASMLTWILKYIHDDPKLLAAIKVTILLGFIHPSINFLNLYKAKLSTNSLNLQVISMYATSV